MTHADIRAAAALALAAAILGGCATTSQPVHTVRCDGPKQSWDDCKTKAAEMCGPNGYDVVSRSDDVAAARASRESGDGFSAPNAVPDARSMVVSCKPK